jgi:hypothetical protein
MTSTAAVNRAYAYAFDIRQIDSGSVVGVGLVKPHERRLSLLLEGASTAVEPELSAAQWDEITAWTTEGDQNLPRQPAPMSGRIVAALLNETDTSEVIGRRIAAIPITGEIHITRLLRGLRQAQ